VPSGGELADRGEHGGAGARGAAQVRLVKSGDGGVDARRQIPGVVVEHLRQAVPWVHGAVRRGPQRPDVVAGLVQPVVGLPQRAPAQVLVNIDQRAPAEERPLPDLIAGDRVRGWQLAIGLAAACLCLGVWRGGHLVQRNEVRSAAAATAHLDLGLSHDRQVELGAVGVLGEDPLDPLAAGPRLVPQHINELAQTRQRRHDHRCHGSHPLGAGLAAFGINAERGVDVGQRVRRAAAQ
jgi:hypothetical protein